MVQLLVNHKALININEKNLNENTAFEIAVKLSDGEAKKHLGDVFALKSTSLVNDGCGLALFLKSPQRYSAFSSEVQ